ncbi:MAG: oligosaccharide flippase family protein [Hominenteromicrobium sp.]
MSEQKGQSFLKGTAILTTATFIVKFINIFFSIPLANFLDDEGMGHFNTAYDIFIFFSVLASSGTPVAISRMVSVAYAQGRKRQADKIFHVAFVLFSCVGLAGSVIMAAFSRQFAILMNQNDRSMYAIAALAPMAFFMSLSSCLRGYFQGRSNMTPTAVSQVLESVIKLFVGIALAMYFMETTGLPELGAAGAITGVSIGSFFAVLYILIYYFRKKKQTEYSPDEMPVSGTKQIVKDILTFAVPVIVGSAFVSALDIVDSAVMMHRLQNAAGISENDAIAMKGWLGMARKYFDLPNAVIVPISTIVLPMLSGVIAKRDEDGIHRISTTGLRMTLMVAIPAAVGLCVFAYPICDLLLYSRPEFAANTAPLLMIMAPAVVTASLMYTTNSMIQAVGKVRIPVINMIAGTVVRIAVVYVLCGIPQVNVLGSAIGTFVSYLVMITLNLFALHRLLPEMPGVLRMSVRPLLAALVMAAVSWPVYWLLAQAISSKIAVIIAILLAIVVYVVAAVFTKAITREEIVHLPKGERIADILRLK